MYYVIYSPYDGFYVSEKGTLDNYDEAAQFKSYTDAVDFINDEGTPVGGLQVVGPCIESEQP